MGLFDKLARRKAEQPFSQQDGAAAILYLTIAADGEISQQEGEQFVAILERMKLFAGQTQEEFGAMADKIRLLLSEHGFDPIVERAAAILPPSLRETVFVHAAELVFADGQVDDNESQFLDSVQEAFGIDDELALKIVEVMQIKNRG